MTDRRRLPSPGAQSAYWALAGTVAAAIVVLALDASWPTQLPVLHQVGLALVVVLASSTSVPIVRSPRACPVPERVALEEAGLVLLLVVLPAGSAWLFGMTCYLGLLVLVRRLSPLKVVFNAGQWSVSFGLAALAFRAITGGGTGVVTPTVAAAALLVVAIHAAVNYLGVGLIVAAVADLPFDRRRDIVRRLYPIMFGGNTLLGLAAGVLWLADPWTVALLWPIALLVLQGYANVVRTDESADETRIERDRLQLVMTQTPTATVLMERDDTISVWNPAMEDLTGIPASAALGHPAQEVLDGQLAHPGSDRGVPLSEVLHPDFAPGELLVRHRDGGHRTVAVVHREHTDRTGDRAGALLLLQDLTPERDAARLKDDFLARVTHELRTPLTSIIGFGRTIRAHGERLSPEQHDILVERVVSSGEELERLVDNLLLVAASGAHGSGRTSERLEARRLAPSVDTAVTLELADHPDRHVEIVEVADATGVIDPAWMTTVVRNLICNGLQYSEPPTHVTVEIDSTDQHGIVRVIDRGRGIPTARLPRIFDRFTRVEDPLLMQTRGAGLGLFIVDRLVGRMGGHVAVDSRLGEGSTFEVRLPVTAPDRPPAAALGPAPVRHG